MTMQITLFFIYIKRELQNPPYFVFWNFMKYLRKVFETPVDDYILFPRKEK